MMSLQVIHQANLFGCALHDMHVHYRGIIYQPGSPHHCNQTRSFRGHAPSINSSMCCQEHRALGLPPYLPAPGIAPHVPDNTKIKQWGPLPLSDMVHWSLITYALYSHAYCYFMLGNLCSLYVHPVQSTPWRLYTLIQTRPTSMLETWKDRTILLMCRPTARHVVFFFEGGHVVF
jgi:hypothetical protein